MKYVAYEWQKSIHLVESDKASFTPAGWHRPYRYSTLDNLSQMKLHPAEKKPAKVSLPGLNTYAKNVRAVSDDIAGEIDDIDDQILALRKQRHSLIVENFRTFDLIKEGDLKRSFEKVFNTKREAEEKTE